MNINITIGVTPQLEKALFGLTSLLGTTQINQAAPARVVSQTAPPVNSAPPVTPQAVQTPTAQTQVLPAQPVPTAVPTFQPQAPVNQQDPTPQLQVVPTAQTQAVPTSAPTYTRDQLAVAATQLVDAGRREDLVQLLATFGAPALMSLPQEQYGAFATKLREMGAKI